VLVWCVVRNEWITRESVFIIEHSVTPRSGHAKWRQCGGAPTMHPQDAGLVSKPKSNEIRKLTKAPEVHTNEIIIAVCTVLFCCIANIAMTGRPVT
jgi:hypothetical protein